MSSLVSYLRGGANSFVTNAGTATPVASVLNILGSGGITTTGSGNTVTVSGSASGITWQVINANQTLASNNGYICSSLSAGLYLALPASSAVGDVIEITDIDPTYIVRVTQANNQQIGLGNMNTTVGTGGSIATTKIGDSVRMICTQANLKWQVVSSMGNITIV